MTKINVKTKLCSQELVNIYYSQFFTLVNITQTRLTDNIIETNN